MNATAATANRRLIAACFALVLATAVFALPAVDDPAPQPQPSPVPSPLPSPLPAPLPLPPPDLTADQVGGLTITLDTVVIPHGDPLTGHVTFQNPLAADGLIELRWVDSFNRLVAQHRVPATAGSTELKFTLDTAPDLTMDNHLSAAQYAAPTPTPAGTPAAAPAQIGSAPPVEFIVTPPADPWDDYQTIMYYAYNETQQDRLREVGITAGMNQARSRILDATNLKTKIWWGHNFRYYCEQILSDVYAEYHRYQGNDPKNIRLVEAKALYKKDKTKLDAFIRKPCFLDPDVKKKIIDVMTQAVQINKKFTPLFYSLADEAGVADLPTAWDFDYDPRTLAAMRVWLKDQYQNLTRLNAEWGTAFNTWDDVIPLTTDQMMQRGDDNFSPWADHRTFMEISFADAVKWGVDAVLKEDPKAYCGLVGCQMPSCFGGYDYWRLSQAMNIIEPYNIGNNREIWRSFHPGTPTLTTSFGSGDQELWRLWHQLLHGDRGIIIYNEKNTLLNPDGTPTDVGKSVIAPYTEFTSGICKLLAHSTSVNDPIQIHYSQPSIHAWWMLEARPGGEKWMDRGSASERKQSEFLRERESFTKLIEDQQLQYTFVAYAQLEQGAKSEFAEHPPKLLFLPQSIAMSATEVKAVEDFVTAGGVVVADNQCALMDEHGKRLKEGALDKLFGITRTNQDFKPAKPGVTLPERAATVAAPAFKLPGRALNLAVAEPGVKLAPQSGAYAFYTNADNVPAGIVRAVGKGFAVYLNLDLTNYHRWRLKPGEDTDARELFAAFSRAAAVQPWVTVTTADAKPVVGVEAFTWTNGPVKILALHRNPQLRVNELGPPEYQSLKAFEDTPELTVTWHGPMAVFDVRAGKLLAANAEKITVTQAPYAPTILAFFPQPPTALTVDLPLKVHRGDAVPVKLAITAPAGSLAATHVLRMELHGPDGKPLPLYARNVALENGAGATNLFLALSDPPGAYKITVHDLLTGLTTEKTVAVDADQ